MCNLLNDIQNVTFSLKKTSNSRKWSEEETQLNAIMSLWNDDSKSIEIKEI